MSARMIGCGPGAFPIVTSRPLAILAETVVIAVGARADVTTPEGDSREVSSAERLTRSAARSALMTSKTWICQKTEDPQLLSQPGCLPTSAPPVRNVPRRVI